MRKPRRHQQLLTILETQLDAEPLPIGRRSLANINRNVKKRAAPTAYQLVLRMRRSLKMQAANGALRHRQRMVVLHELGGNPMFRQRARAVAFREEPTVIAEAGRGDYEDNRQWRLLNFDGQIPRLTFEYKINNNLTSCKIN